MTLEDDVMDNRAAVLREFEREPLRSLPSLRELVVNNQVFAYRYEVEEPDGSVYFFLFDLERHIPAGASAQQIGLIAAHYHDEMAEAYVRYRTTNRTVN